jgi:5,10-methenyltetrahydrofolate synthetase
LASTGVPGSDLRQPEDVAHWRKLERERLIRARLELPVDHGAARSLAIAGALSSLIPAVAGTLVSVYWPIKGEPDLRPWMQATWERGVRVALPVAIALGQPLMFREWRPHARMARGLWNIPYPAEGAEVLPTVMLAPLVGFDKDCFRLGYGGGFFDRTLARIPTKPLAIGVGYADALIATIFPQTYDIPMDWIVTEATPPLRRGAAEP